MSNNLMLAHGCMLLSLLDASAVIARDNVFIKIYDTSIFNKLLWYMTQLLGELSENTTPFYKTQV